MNSIPWLTLVVLIPWVVAGVLYLLPPLSRPLTTVLGLAGSLSTLLLGVFLAVRFSGEVGPWLAEERMAWMHSLPVGYHLGLDGMSLLLVLLTGLIGPASLLASRNLCGDRAFAALFLVLQGSALGVFLSLDFFLWFVFWEMSLVPGFFLMKLWGGAGSSRAAYQFFVYTVGGSAFLLLAFGALYALVGTGDFVALADLARSGQLAELLGPRTGLLLCLGVFVGVAVKAALFPFHTWLPDAYAEAPTGASMFFTAVLSKMGVYGFLRILWPLFPAELERLAPVLLALAVAGVVFGALAALRQKDLKRIVAYSSVNHVSYCLLALFAVVSSGTAGTVGREAALTGALLQMFNHGLSAAALFAVVGILEARSGGRDLDGFGGVRTAAPVLAGLSGLALFSSLGLPALNGFVGEFLIFKGTFALVPSAAAFACIGLLATAFFLLTFYQRVFSGPVGPRVVGMLDVSRVEFITLASLGLLMVVLGLWPQLLTGLISPLISHWVPALP